VKNRILELFSSHRFLILFITIVIVLVVMPFLDYQRSLFGPLFLLPLLVAVIRTLEFNKTLTRIMICLDLVALALQWSSKPLTQTERRAQ